MECPDPKLHKFSWGGHTTDASAHPLHTPGMMAEAVLTAGMVLFSHVREARWQGIRTKEYPVQWNFLPKHVQKEWEEAAVEIGKYLYGAQLSRIQKAVHEGMEFKEQQCPGCRGLKQVSGVDCALCEGAGTVWVEVPV